MNPIPLLSLSVTVGLLLIAYQLAPLSIIHKSLPRKCFLIRKSFSTSIRWVHICLWRDFCFIVVDLDVWLRIGQVLGPSLRWKIRILGVFLVIGRTSPTTYFLSKSMCRQCICPPFLRERQNRAALSFIRSFNLLVVAIGEESSWDYRATRVYPLPQPPQCRINQSRGSTLDYMVIPWDPLPVKPIRLFGNPPCRGATTTMPSLRRPRVSHWRHFVVPPGPSLVNPVIYGFKWRKIRKSSRIWNMSSALMAFQRMTLIWSRIRSRSFTRLICNSTTFHLLEHSMVWLPSKGRIYSLSIVF